MMVVMVMRGMMMPRRGRRSVVMPMMRRMVMYVRRRWRRQDMHVPRDRRIIVRRIVNAIVRAGSDTDLHRDLRLSFSRRHHEKRGTHDQQKKHSFHGLTLHWKKFRLRENSETGSLIDFPNLLKNRGSLHETEVPDTALSALQFFSIHNSYVLSTVTPSKFSFFLKKNQKSQKNPSPSLQSTSQKFPICPAQRKNRRFASFLESILRKIGKICTFKKIRIIVKVYLFICR